MKLKIIAACFLLLVSNGAFAEGNCPPGYFPTPHGCAPAGVPTDGYRDYKDLVERERASQGAGSASYGSTAHLKVVDTYSAVAWHPNANDYWAIWDNKDSEGNAKERVLKACNQTMGGGCAIAASGKNLTVCIATVDGVVTEMAWDEDDAIALMGVMKKCETKWGDRCEPFVRIKPSKVYSVKWDTSIDYLPNAKQVHLLDKSAKRIERSSDAAINHLDLNNVEGEAKHFIDKWSEKIKKIAQKRY